MAKRLTDILEEAERLKRKTKFGFEEKRQPKEASSGEEGEKKEEKVVEKRVGKRVIVRRSLRKQEKPKPPKKEKVEEKKEPEKRVEAEGEERKKSVYKRLVEVDVPPPQKRIKEPRVSKAEAPKGKEEEAPKEPPKEAEAPSKEKEPEKVEKKVVEEKVEKKVEERPEEKKEEKKEEFKKKKRKERPERFKKRPIKRREIIEELKAEEVLREAEVEEEIPEVVLWQEGEEEGEEKPKKEVQKAGKKEKASSQPRKVKLEGETITISELSRLSGIKAMDLMSKLIDMGVMANINQPIDTETAALILTEFNVDVEVAKVDLEEEILKEPPEDPKKLKPRPPVVTVMGHVDHGKTTLLDAIREARVAEKEAGGITQHIGAYLVEKDGRKICFVDTPGHESFTHMRARGAQVTDIVVLVVAADDGVMPQTVEAIDHAKNADVPIVVAINKIDKPDAKPDLVKTQLAEHGIVPEEWGGNNLFVEVSAKKRMGIEDLLEAILLQAEMLEIKANPEKPGRAVIIESRLDKGKGPVATVIVKEGKIRIGDYFVAGTTYGRVRSMFDDRGKMVKEATPSMPVEIVGFSEVPEAGEKLYVVESEDKAKKVAELRKEKRKKEVSTISLEDIFKKLEEGEIKELQVVLKTDVLGTMQALSDSLQKLGTDKVKVNIVHKGVGAITEGDVVLAKAAKGIVIGFNVRPTPKAREMAEREGVDVRLYSVIYELLDDVKKAMKGLLEPKKKEEVIGLVEVRKVFKISRIGTVAGCYVKEGVVQRNAKARLIRDGVVIHDGEISSLKRFKDDVREVAQGYECGLMIKDYNDIKEGDEIEVYKIVFEEQEL